MIIFYHALAMKTVLVCGFCDCHCICIVIKLIFEQIVSLTEVNLKLRYL